ncbi:MAG: hypothetical protein GF346_01265 [Candidatus Eisenbacteria bacterium]|nr:hypothetical protein [Candidatus Latescibacterota bacterium]MBD3301059.1 hypothetical protein [Candidatus Eisenbacteria bacterium]
MRAPSRTHSGETMRRAYGLYHLTRLKGEPELAERAAAFGQAQEALERRIATHAAAREATMVAMAVRDAKEEKLNIAVRNLFLSLRRKLQTNRKAPTFRAFFPDGLSEVLNLPLEEKLDRVKVLLAHIEEEADEAFSGEAEPLAAAGDAAQGALEAYEAAVLARAEAWSLLRAEKLVWLKAYRNSYRNLQILFADDPQRAEAYFRRPHRRSDPDEEEAEGSGEPDIATEEVEDDRPDEQEETPLKIVR